MADLKLLQTGASELGLELTRDQLSAFSRYMNELLRWNQKSNLTAIVAPEEMQTKHFLDSLTCLLAFPGVDAETVDQGSNAHGKLDLGAQLNGGTGISCLDIGTGAGFPGIPLKICLPNMKLTLLESIGKKTAFLSHIVQLLKLDDTRVVTGRAEDLAKSIGEREAFDVVVARAVSNLAVLAELCLPFCRLGGRVIAPKKGDITAEIEEGRYAVQQMGGRYGSTVSIRSSLLEDERCLVVMEKESPTPHQYPRRSGMPVKRPLLASGGAEG
ncbi:MAG TPA: 16S rRNA (guanine(527)-N(7))-methyltransferase RsmG [Chloroflexota bacterium]|nr:16S rRNA (guanine(527)-N(7))-methyltransferase RsmG [Chloroflexota bacterium]